MDPEVDAPTEPTSAEGAPEDVTGTPPVEGEPEPEPPADETPDDEGDEEEPQPTAAEKSKFAKLRAKYPNMSDEEFQETIADNYWRSTKEISSDKKRIRELEAALEEREQQAQAEPEPEPELPPNPQIERLDARIKTLYGQAEAMKTEQTGLLSELPKVDREIAKCEARIEDAGGEYGDDAKRTTWERKKEVFEVRKEALVDKIKAIHANRERADYELETLLADKDWYESVAKQQQQQMVLAEKNRRQFNSEFPQYIDGLIAEHADNMGAPKDERVRQSLWKHVNRAITMDFWTKQNQGLDEVDVPEMVGEHVKEYLEDRDLVNREKFNERSKEKLKVTSRTPAPSGRKASPAVKPPVPISQLGKGGLSPGMAAARKYLSSKGL